jgi:hypothetical protein
LRNATERIDASSDRSHQRFTEGFNTADLKDAKALLEESSR